MKESEGILWKWLPSRTRTVSVNHSEWQAFCRGAAPLYRRFHDDHKDQSWGKKAPSLMENRTSATLGALSQAHTYAGGYTLPFKAAAKNMQGRTFEFAFAFPSLFTRNPFTVHLAGVDVSNTFPPFHAHTRGTLRRTGLQDRLGTNTHAHTQHTLRSSRLWLSRGMKMKV